jgi:hypothetical protein
MNSRARAGNLTAALVFVAALELVLNRVANRLFLPRSIISGANAGASMMARAVADSGPFLFHLTGVLALMLFALSLAGLLRRHELFPEPVPARMVVSTISGAFGILATLVILVGQVPRAFVLPLEASFGFLSLLIAGAFLRSRVPARVKIGVLLFTLPALLHVASMVLEKMGWGRARSAVGDLFPWGEASLILAAATAPLTLTPSRPGPGRRLLALGIALALTLSFGVALAVRYDLMQAIALYGPHLEMPRLASPMGLAYLVAALGWSYTVARLLAQRGGTRLAAYGLLLLAIGGYPLGSPVELSVSLLGLLALSVGELRAQKGAATAPADSTASGMGTPALNRTDWRAWIGQLATAAHDGTAAELGPPEAVVVEEDDLEASRIRGQRRGRGVGLRFLRRRGRITELEVTVGDPGHREPTASIERHRSWLARNPEQRLPLPRIKTGDATFDQKFSVHGTVPLDDEALRSQIARLDDGVLSIWTGTAARYQATIGSADTHALVSLLDLMIDLVEKGASASAGAPAPGGQRT